MLYMFAVEDKENIKYGTKVFKALNNYVWSTLRYKGFFKTHPCLGTRKVILS